MASCPGFYTEEHEERLLTRFPSFFESDYLKLDYLKLKGD
jgi:hypothetical protein